MLLIHWVRCEVWVILLLNKNCCFFLRFIFFYVGAYSSFLEENFTTKIKCLVDLSFNKSIETEVTAVQLYLEVGCTSSGICLVISRSGDGLTYFYLKEYKMAPFTVQLYTNILFFSIIFSNLLEF
jgi:hypothetical protein